MIKKSRGATYGRHQNYRHLISGADELILPPRCYTVFPCYKGCPAALVHHYHSRVQGKNISVEIFLVLLTMLLKDFYRRVILTEDTAVTFLREHNLLEAPNETASCHRCGSIMLEKRKRDRWKF